MKRGSSRRGTSHPYCLRCYSPLERSAGATQRCGRCSFVNANIDHALFWTKEPYLVGLEAYAKIATVIVVACLIGLIYWAMGRQPSYGLGGGWAIGFPILLGVVLWDTASAITRKTSDYRASIVWRWICAFLAPWPFLLALDLNPWAKQKGLLVSIPAFVAMLLPGLLFAGGALGLGRLARWLIAWREQHVWAAQQRILGPYQER